MTKRSALRERIAWAAFVVLLCSLVASFRMRPITRPIATERIACLDGSRDSTLIARLASDTIATLRARTQQVRRFTRRPTGIEVRTEDADSLAAHDGGLVAFDCSGRMTFLWLDGG